MTSSSLTGYERTAYFDGQRMTAADLTAATDYSRGLRQLHNRALHGWGVVTGLGVSGARGAQGVSVQPGLALDCTGRELLLTEAQDVQVPPVAEEASWFLVIRGLSEELTTANRIGVCDTDGAVRLLDVPEVRWLSAAAKNGARVRRGLDVVLAETTVARCRLSGDLELDARQQLAPEQPYVWAGETDAGSASWRPWPAQGGQLGVMTTVSTAEAGFRSVPSYQARLSGERAKDNTVLDGPVHIEAAGADSFDFCVGLNMPQSKIKTINTDLLQKLGWRVVWMGVEM